MATDTHPHPTQTDTVQSFRNLLQEALALHQRGLLEHAERLYLKALRLIPEQSDGLHLLGVNLLQQGRAEEGADCITRAIKVNPHNPQCYYNLGNAMREIGDLDEALRTYARALEIRPRYVEALNAMGVVLTELGQAQRALDYFDRALGLNESFAELHNSRAAALRRLNRFEEALQSYSRVEALMCPTAEVLHNKGNVLRDLKRYDEALLAYDGALAIRSDYAEIHNSRGSVLKDMRRLSESLDSFKQAIAIKPDYAAPFCGRGMCFMELEQWEDAERELEKALSLDPENESAISQLSRLPRDRITKERANELLGVLDTISRPQDPAALLFTRANLLAHLGRHNEGLELARTAQSLRHSVKFEGNDVFNGRLTQLELTISDWRPATCNMEHDPDTPKLLVILGPSRSGKTTLERLLCVDERFLRGFEGRIAHEACERIERQYASRAVGQSRPAEVIHSLLTYVPPGPRAQQSRVVTITNPFLITAAHRIFELHAGSYFVFLERDPLDTAAEIIVKDFAFSPFFSSSPQAAYSYVTEYIRVARILADKMGPRAMMLDFATFVSTPHFASRRVHELLGIGSPVPLREHPDVSADVEIVSPYRHAFLEMFEACKN